MCIFSGAASSSPKEGKRRHTPEAKPEPRAWIAKGVSGLGAVYTKVLGCYGYAELKPGGCAKYMQRVSLSQKRT